MLDGFHISPTRSEVVFLREVKNSKIIPFYFLSKDSQLKRDRSYLSKRSAYQSASLKRLQEELKCKSLIHMKVVQFLIIYMELANSAQYRINVQDLNSRLESMDAELKASKIAGLELRKECQQAEEAFRSSNEQLAASSTTLNLEIARLSNLISESQILICELTSKVDFKDRELEDRNVVLSSTIKQLEEFRDRENDIRGKLLTFCVLYKFP